LGKIKVLQLGSPAALYGAERWILALIKHMDKQTFDIQVAAFQDDPSLTVPLCTEAKKLGFKTKIFKTPGRFNLSAVSQLKKFIVENEIHILHTHAYKQDIIGLLASVGTKCKIVTTPHGWSKEPDLKLWCYEMANRAVFPFFNAVVPLSEELYRPLKRLPLGKKLHLIRNGVDLTEIDAVTELSPEIKKLKRENQFIIGYIGQLINRKGLDILLKALAQLKDSFNWHLLVVGQGSMGSSLKKMAQELSIDKRVHFLGFRQDRLSLLKGFDLFVLPSRLEGIPRCLMEAMAAQVPVIASNIPGCIDLIDDGQTGFLFEAEHSSDLAHTIEKVRAMTPAKLEDLTQRARGLIEKNFSAQRMAKEYGNLFIKLLERP